MASTLIRGADLFKIYDLWHHTCRVCGKGVTYEFRAPDKPEPDPEDWICARCYFKAEGKSDG